MRLEAGGGEPERGFGFEGTGDGDEGFEAGEVGAAFDGGELADADGGGFGEVFEGPAFVGAGEADVAAEFGAEAVLGAAAEVEVLDGLGEGAAEFGHGEGLGDVVKDILFECLAHVVHGGVAGDDDDAEAGPAFADVLEDFVAAVAAHFHVEEDEVGEVGIAG